MDLSDALQFEYKGNEWDVASAGSGDSGLLPPPPRKTQQQQQPKKRKRIVVEEEEPAAKRARVLDEGAYLDDLFGDAAVSEAAAAAAAGGENKNGRPPLRDRPRNLLREDCGLPDWKLVDDLEPEASDDPSYIPMLSVAPAGTNTYFDDWMKIAYDLFWQMDLLQWTLELQRQYNKNLYCWYQDDPSIPRQRPFYRSAIFAYFDRHRRPPWFVKGVRLVTLQYHLKRMDCTLVAMENGRVLNVAKDNVTSYEKMQKMVTQLENEVAKLKKN